MTDEQRSLSCAETDELAAPYLLGAVDADEAAAIAGHLATCDEAHAELREGVGGELLALGLEPVAPSPRLRERLMATVERTPQDHAPVAPSVAATVQPAPAPAPRADRFGWLTNGWARGMAVAAVVAVVALGAWNIGLQGQLRDSRAVADAIANATAVHSVQSDAGRGLLLDTGSGAAFVPSAMASLPSNQVYEAWLIPADGAPLGVATFRAGDQPMLVQLDHALSDYAQFVITVEPGFVQAPTGPAVMSFAIGS
jgi:anti-sigma-K factor RskA